MADMWALTFDRSREDWATSKGLVRERLPVPTLHDGPHGPDRASVIIRVKYAGFCGSDRGIWSRRAFGDMILGSLDEEGRDKRIVGHELLGEIVEVGSRAAADFHYRVGEIVSTESHIVCGVCYQCQRGEHHVCQRDRIIGISQDGCFAEYIKLPAKALWRTDLDRIRPEVAAVQEPFGNAVHACTTTDLSGKRVAILGTGTIGLFAALIAKGMGARQVIAVEPDAHHRDLARRLGADELLDPGLPPADAPWQANDGLREQIMDLTDGIGVDVAMEMAGFNSSVNNALRITRRGGHVVLFGLKNGELRLQDAHRIIMNGLTLHGVVGRHIFKTWDMTRALLENPANGIQDAIWKVILREGDGTIAPIETWTPAGFEQMIDAHPKPVIRFAG